jgi:RNA polymerase sigma-70 factor (ECF subfamily)
MRVSEMSSEDAQLIARFLDRDEQAFDQLVLKYQHLVYNLCLRMLENPEDAADCAQETFIKVYQALKGFRFESSFSTWLYRITINNCKNKVNSKERRTRNQMIAIDHLETPEGERVPLEIKDDGESPAYLVEQKMTLEMILKAIGALPADQKILVILCDIDDRSYDEIVQITGLKLGTVKSRLARARYQLRKRLEGVISG